MIFSKLLFSYVEGFGIELNGLGVLSLIIVDNSEVAASDGSMRMVFPKVLFKYV